MEKINILSNLIEFKTDGREDEINECQKYISSILEEYGWKTKLIPNNENGKLNLIAILNGEFDKINEGILLAGHIDTVQTDKELWKGDPLKIRIEEDFLYGLGIADMKSFSAAILSNLSEINNLKLKKPIVFVLTNDEETVMYSINKVVEFFKNNNILPEFALIGEPSSMMVANSNKGFYEFETTIRGVACHSSNPEKGTNAIYIMSKFVSFIENLSKRFDDTTINVGLVNGGRMCNIVADNCAIRWDVRTSHKKDLEDIVEFSNKFLKTLCAEYKNSSFSNEIVFNIPLFEDKKGKYSNLIIEKYDMQEKPYAASTEAGFYQELGIECIIYGCGDIDDAHAINESINSKNYLQYCDRLLSIIKDIC